MTLPNVLKSHVTTLLLMKQVFSSPDSAQVGLAKSLLDAMGIQNEVRNDAISGAIPGAAFSAELWVLNDEDYDQARRLILEDSGTKESA
jgi:hypothetical protein